MTNSARPTVLLIGCGWLGLPLAGALVAAGHAVLGTTTTPDKLPAIAATGAQPHLLRLTDAPDAATQSTLTTLVNQADIIVLNVPPPRAAPPAAYAALLQPIQQAAAQASRPVLFVSSTGVYPDEPRPMRETDALASAAADSALLRAENLFPTAAGHTVLRLGGLFGPGRPPGRFLAGRTYLPQGNAPINLLHLTDAVGIIIHLLKQSIQGHTLNACAASHPLRRDFYPAAARQLGLEPPTFLPESGITGKTIDSGLLRQLTGYRFRHDDLLAALTAS